MGLNVCHYVPAAEGIDFLKLEDMSVNPTFFDSYKHFTKEVDFDGEIVRVLYIAEKGHQRKQMSARFFETFENDKLYFDLENVIKASKYLAPWPGVSLPEIQQSFKEDFIDNFVEGESIFVAGW